ITRFDFRGGEGAVPKPQFADAPVVVLVGRTGRSMTDIQRGVDGVEERTGARAGRDELAVEIEAHLVGRVVVGGGDMMPDIDARNDVGRDPRGSRAPERDAPAAALDGETPALVTIG